MFQRLGDFLFDVINNFNRIVQFVTIFPPKLFPKISPNKTWSGFLCSIFFSIIVSIIFINFFPLTNLFYASLIGFFVGLGCSAGDLFESWLKRINTKKDTSNLIPGHGGLLDRLDGFLFGIIIMFIMTLTRG